MARQRQNVPLHQVSESNCKMFRYFMCSDVMYTDDLCLLKPGLHGYDCHWLPLSSKTYIQNYLLIWKIQKNGTQNRPFFRFEGNMRGC